MRAAPIGAVVRITYDAPCKRNAALEHVPDVTVAAGDFLSTHAGRCYEVLAARRMRSKHPNRWRLELLVIEAIPARRDPLAIVHPLVFYRRG